MRFIIKPTILLFFTTLLFGIAKANDNKKEGKTETDQQAKKEQFRETPENKVNNFPNAIVLDRNDINNVLVGLVGDDPNGIASLLALKAGLTFRNTGDAGAETWFIVRNFGRDNSRMTLILLDGRPLNLANNHTVEFDDIPVNIIESITIYPGPVPVEYGGFQSVIDIKTQRNVDVNFVAANVGTDNNYRITATHGKSGRFHYLANLDIDMADGMSNQRLSGILEDFTYTDRSVRTVLPTFKVGYEVSKDLDITLQGNFVHFKKMFHDAPLFGEEASRERNMQNLSLVFQPGRESNKDYQLLIYRNNESETLNAIFPEDVDYNVNWGNQSRVFTGFRAHYKETLVENKIALKIGGEGHSATGSTDNDYNFFKFIDNQAFYGAYLKSELSLWEGSYMELGFRVDGQTDIDQLYVSPVASIAQDYFNNRVSLYSSFGVQRRWIPLNEVNTFHRPERVLGPPFLANSVNMPKASLAMERFVGFDGGVRFKALKNRVHAQINYFHLVNQGQFGTPHIQVASVNQGPPVPPGMNAALVMADRNFPGTDVSRGIEFDVEAKLMKGLSLFANAIYFIESETQANDDVVIYEGPMGGPAAQPILNQSVGQFILPYHNSPIIPGTYEWLANAGLIYRPDEKTIFNFIARYRGATTNPLMKFGMDPQVDEIPQNLIFDFSVGRDIVAKDKYIVRAMLSTNNLFNTSYQTFVHYPMQGRFISCGLSANF